MDTKSPIGDNKIDTADIEGENALKTTDLPADADLAADFLANTDGYGPLTSEEEIKLKRKIDWTMIPMVSSRASTTLPY